jgi:allantoin racemase
VPVLELEAPGSRARERISAEIHQAIRDDRAEAIVLGCAGMTEFASALSHEHGVPVLDGVACAVKLSESLVALGLRTSKSGGYATPRAKRFAGLFAPFSPDRNDDMASSGAAARSEPEDT